MKTIYYSASGLGMLCPNKISNSFRERGGLVVNASDSGSRGREFEPDSGQTVLCP